MDFINEMEIPNLELFEFIQFCLYNFPVVQGLRARLGFKRSWVQIPVEATFFSVFF
jgi:hypothetical protein